MSKSNGPKNSVEVLNINSDLNQFTGELFYRVDIGMQTSIPKTSSSTMSPFPQSNIPSLKPLLTIYFLHTEWKNQYQVGQKYDFTMNEHGDLTHKKSEKT
jgi:hypothetical protein